MTIDEGTMRLIYAYSDQTPVKGDIAYHKKDERGSKSVALLSFKNDAKEDIDDAELQHWDVLSPNFEITPDFESKYWCKIYKGPKLDEKHHIVKVEPLVQPESEPFVHHFLLYECSGADASYFEPHAHAKGHQCRVQTMPEAFEKCTGVFLVWGVGGQDLVLPNDVGYPLQSSPTKYYLLEMHYDNPHLKGGIIDSSGFRIHYTKKLRKFDAGTVMVGSAISPRMLIPPGQPEYTVVGHSSPECLTSVLPDDGIKIFGVFLHSHLLGRRIVARHFRGNKELPPLLNDSHYDFNYQDYRYKTVPVSLLKEDQVTVECVYDTTGRNFTTFGGESTREEMCLAFLLYYPRIERFASLSVPKLKNINYVFRKNFTRDDIWFGLRRELKTFDWNTLQVENVQKVFRFSRHETICYFGDDIRANRNSSVSYPPELIPYETHSSCKTADVKFYTTDGSNSLSAQLLNLSICICTFILLVSIRSSL